MALVLVDKNRKRTRHLQDLLEKTIFGQDLENFLSGEKALEWCEQNECHLMLIDEDIAEDYRYTYPFKNIVKQTPILILRNDNKRKEDFNEIPLVEYLGPKVTLDKLLQSAEYLIHLSSVQKADDENKSRQPLDLEGRYALAISAANDGVWDWDLENQKIYYSKRWLEIIGYTEEDNNESPMVWFSRVHPEDVALLDTAIDAQIRGATERLVCEYRIRHKNGFYRWVLTRGKAVFDAKNKAVRIVGSQTDITERKITEEQLAYDALHDPLTGLANRSLLTERLRQVLRNQKRDSTQLSSVLFIDLDKFKQINDNLGHEAGDEILKALAQRLYNCSRENDTVARIGGDEFIMLAAGLETKEDAIILAKRIMEEVDKPYLIGNDSIHVGVSIGILLIDKSYEDTEAVIRDADLALYEAKTKGRHRFEIFNQKMQINKSQHFALQSTLSGAIDRRELMMHYQPICDLKTLEVKGFEALMRWKHPENGFIYPLDFIPLAEETGLINELGAWGFNAACKELLELQRFIPHSKDWFMTVNVSGRQLHNSNFQKMAKYVFKDLGVNPENIWLELTEGALMRGADIISPHIHALKDLGVKMAIDDFGTGYSSLSLIHEYNFDVLKIPRDFIMDIDKKPKNLRTVKLIELLAKETKMKTVIEGIERIEEYNILKPTACDYTQGFLFCKPLAALDLIHTLKEKTAFSLPSTEKKEKNKVVI